MPTFSRKIINLIDLLGQILSKLMREKNQLHLTMIGSIQELPLLPERSTLDPEPESSSFPIFMDPKNKKDLADLITLVVATKLSDGDYNNWKSLKQSRRTRKLMTSKSIQELYQKKELKIQTESLLKQLQAEEQKQNEHCRDNDKYLKIKDEIFKKKTSTEQILTLSLSFITNQENISRFQCIIYDTRIFNHFPQSLIIQFFDNRISYLNNIKIQYMQTTEYQEIKQLFEQTFIIESITQFIRKVYLLLESKEYEDLISWHTDNQTVVIKDVKKLVHRVLPTVFKQKTLRSFVRQLNMYGFNKVKMNEESEELYFKNKNFMRGNFQDLVFIKRKQRGYVEKTKLEKNRQTNTFERYKIYTDGILGELKKEFLKKTKKSRFPELHAELEKIFHQHETMNYESLSNSASRSGGSSLASHRSQNQIDIFHTIIPQPTPTTDLRLINMFESFQSVYQLPMFKSTFSLFGDHFQ